MLWVYGVNGDGGSDARIHQALTESLAPARYEIDAPSRPEVTEFIFVARIALIADYAANAKLRGDHKRRVKCEACADWGRPANECERP